MGPGFSPLDEELGLLPGLLSPTLAAGAIRLGTDLSFERAARTLAYFWRVDVGTATVRRYTEAAGAALVAEQTAATEHLEASVADPPPGPARLQVSLDGAMVPLVGGSWAEVKTAALGVLPVPAPGVTDIEPHATELSYFSRLADAATFTRLVAVEFDRRGLERAGDVLAIMDGAEWQQGTVDRYRPDAVRILDFPHVVEHLSEAAQAVWGSGSATVAAWLDQSAHTLKHAEPDDVLAALWALPVATARDPAAAARIQAGTVAYLEKRREQIRYAAFRERGYPIGSGIVESANKLVVEARLKGSGMHWLRDSVNPMLALRTVTCAERWEEALPRIHERVRAAAADRRATRRRARSPQPAPDATTTDPAPVTDADRSVPPTPPSPERPKLIIDGRPTANHPWRLPLAANSGKI